jgi:hypothetical protein
MPETILSSWLPEFYRKQIYPVVKDYFFLNFIRLIGQPSNTMKKTLILICILIVAGVGKSVASHADLFRYDAVNIANQMAPLNQLEEYILENPGITLSQIAGSGNLLASLVVDPNGINGFNRMNEKVLGIPGFLWGCTIGWVGILIVYLNGADPNEIKQATIGCIVETAVWVGCYASIYLIYGASLMTLLSSSYY